MRFAEDVFDEETAYLDMLANEVRNAFRRVDAHSIVLTQRARLSKAVSGEEDEDDEEDIDDEPIEEELGFISPLDTVDPYSTFKNALACKCDLSHAPS
jgi:hypothetical protein